MYWGYVSSQRVRFSLFPSTGHFTQVVWKASREVGVAEVVTSTNKRFIVARYSPAGNIEGQFKANVPRPLNGNMTKFTKHKCVPTKTVCIYSVTHEILFAVSFRPTYRASLIWSVP